MYIYIYHTCIYHIFCFQAFWGTSPFRAQRHSSGVCQSAGWREDDSRFQLAAGLWWSLHVKRHIYCMKKSSIFVSTHTIWYLYICIYIYIYVYLHTCKRTYIYIYTHLHTFKHIYIYTYFHSHIYRYIDT